MNINNNSNNNNLHTYNLCISHYILYIVQPVFKKLNELKEEYLMRNENRTIKDYSLNIFQK